MERSHQVEHEVKLEVGPDWALPDLAGVFQGAEARPLASVQLETTYYDTPSRRLGKRRISLRHREQRPVGPGGKAERQAGSGGAGSYEPEASSEWTVKLPPATEGAALGRTEVNWPERDAGASPHGSSGPPGEVAKLLAAVTLGEAFEPIARLSSARRRTQILAGGRPAAEVDDDSVEGTSLAVAQEAGPASGQEPRQRTVVSFREVEVELAEGAPADVLETVVARLVAAGARPTARKSKLVTVLQSAAQPAPGGQEVSEVQAEKATCKQWKGARMATVLRYQAGACLDVLVEHDPPVRLGDPDPEHVHKARVATRRLRSVLWALRRLPGGDEEDIAPAMGWLAAFRRELRWLGGALGAARDADVRVMNLEAASAKLSPADQGAAARVVEAARSEQSLAHQKLLEAMDSERYLVVLRCLDAVAGRAGATQASSTTGLAAPPEQLWRHLEVPASSAMAHLGARQWRSARRAVRRLGNPPSDEALHRLRIETKRLRYIAEVAAPVLRPAPSRRAAQAMAAAATDLQDVLGGLHDSVVSEQWLRDLAARPVWGAEGASGDLGTAAATAGSAAAAAGNDTAAGAGSDLALVAGELVAAARSTAAACRATWEQKWRRLERKELAKWLAGGR